MCAGKKCCLPHLSSQAANEWSAEEHRIAAALFKEEAVRLEAKVAHLNKRVERFTKKFYFDTKGFRRQSARRLRGAYRVEFSELREHMTWHHGEAERFNAMHHLKREKH